MQALAAIGFGIFIIVSLTAGIRLILLHRRTGALPELLLGGMLVLVSGLGYPLRVVAEGVAQDWAGTLIAIADTAVNLGHALFFVFTWRVFRAQETWARILAACGVMIELTIAAYSWVQAQSGASMAAVDMTLGEILLRTAPVLVAFLWTGLESFRYYAMMRRRLSLGLADPVVSERFLLWGLMSVCSLLGATVSAGAVAAGVDSAHEPLVLLSSSMSGAGQAVFLLLALLPPKPYVSWVRARAASAARA